jgi:hypothetical protein
MCHSLPPLNCDRIARKTFDSTGDETTMRFFTVLLALKTLLNLIVWLPIPLFPQQPTRSRLSR